TIRVDFARSPTFGERTMIIGEAAGLVNPITGEGIDYGMESGKLAAEYLTHMFAIGDFSLKQLAAFDKQLRQRYQSLFVLCDRLRLLYLNPLFAPRLLQASGPYDQPVLSCDRRTQEAAWFHPL